VVRSQLGDQYDVVYLLQAFDALTNPRRVRYRRSVKRERSIGSWDVYEFCVRGCRLWGVTSPP
jgi:hypothetical protein